MDDLKCIVSVSCLDSGFLSLEEALIHEHNNPGSVAKFGFAFE